LTIILTGVSDYTIYIARNLSNFYGVQYIGFGVAFRKYPFFKGGN
jgi:hypothetical protein